jgi:hypothetical protein
MGLIIKPIINPPIHEHTCTVHTASVFIPISAVVVAVPSSPDRNPRMKAGYPKIDSQDRNAPAADE